MKLNVNKYNKNRDKSYELSKKRDYKLISHIDGKNDTTSIIDNLRVKLYSIECEHDKVGCELKKYKRTYDKCVKCPLN